MYLIKFGGFFEYKAKTFYCLLFHFAALTKCEYKRLEMRHRHFDDINAVPRCNEDGSFVEIQCLPELNSCWCVDEHGSERNGTRQEGKPTNCKALGPGRKSLVNCLKVLDKECCYAACCCCYRFAPKK